MFDNPIYIYGYCLGYCESVDFARFSGHRILIISYSNKYIHVCLAIIMYSYIYYLPKNKIFSASQRPKNIFNRNEILVFPPIRFCVIPHPQIAVAMILSIIIPHFFFLKISTLSIFVWSKYKNSET